MTKTDLESVVEELVSIVDSWNDAQADDDRGRGNHALCLTLFDDGSGWIGQRRFMSSNEVEDMHEFGDVEGLLRVLQVEGVEIADI